MSTIKVTNIQHGSAGSAAITLNSDGQATLNGLNFPTAGSLGNRNLVINGAMHVAQRGTSFTGLLDSGVYLVDRFAYRRSGNWGTNNFTATQESSGAPGGFKHFLRLTQAGTAAAPPTNADCRLATFLEGNTITQAAFGTSDAQPLTLSFYARASQAGTYCVSLGSGSGQTYIEEYSVTTSWQRFTVNIPARTTGTWNTDTSTGFYLHWIVAADSDGEQSGSTGWTATDDRYTTNQIETFASTSGATFDLCGVQLEIGDVATPFEHRTRSVEIGMCQRYYCQSYNFNIAPGSSTYVGAIHCRNDQNITMASHFTNTRFPVVMRGVPTVTLYSPQDGAANRISDWGSGSSHVNNGTVSSVTHIGSQGFGRISLSTAEGPAIIFHYTADAEL